MRLWDVSIAATAIQCLRPLRRRPRVRQRVPQKNLARISQVAALHVAAFAQTFEKRVRQVVPCLGRLTIEEANHRRRLLRAHGNRPSCRPAAENSIPRCGKGIAALRDFDPAYARFGSWLCENSSARRARRNISKKLRTTESNRAPRTMFDTLLENCIFYIAGLYEFSHRLGQYQSFGDVRSMSGLPESGHG